MNKTQLFNLKICYVIGYFTFQARAKQLYTSGYKSLSHIAHADPVNIVKHIKLISKKAATQIVTSAKVYEQIILTS